MKDINKFKRFSYSSTKCWMKKMHILSDFKSAKSISTIVDSDSYKQLSSWDYVHPNVAYLFMFFVKEMACWLERLE